jgi:two-component system, OmpR family, sensor kinase
MSLASATRTRWATTRRAWAGVPLRARLVTILLVALLSSLALTGWATQFILRGYLVGQLDASLSANARQAGQYAAFYYENRGLSRGSGLQDLAVALWPLDGRAAVLIQSMNSTDRPALPTPTQADAGSLTIHHAPSATGGATEWHYVTVAVRTPPDDVSYLAVVAAPLTPVERTVAQLRLLILGLGGIVVVLCALLGWMAIRRSFQPLVEVEETAAAIAAGDLSRRIPERPKTTEVGRLTASLNGMLTQIESAFRARATSEERTRRFAADASHELRTPLASIRGFAELYRQGAVPPDEVPRTMRRIEDEARRMGGLVEDLLLLARLDARRPAKTEPVDLAVLAGDAVHDAHGLAPDRSVRLVGLDGVAGPTPAVVIGDEGHLRQVVTNLVANAVRHTPAGTPIEVAVGAAQDDGEHVAVLEVRDHGPGLQPEAAERVFERFYRVDSSRQRGTGGGSGLGLSIVAAVTAAHDGTVTTRQTPGGGATFRVALPLATVPAPAS